jgi:hypothetical protein
LATFSSLRSSRSAKRARIRASTATWLEEVWSLFIFRVKFDFIIGQRQVVF